MILLTFGAGSYAQFITVLIVFVVVLGITAFVTKWMAGYQKQQNRNRNVEVIETSRIGNNKYIQIVRVGEKYMVIAVCKDAVTMLGEIPREQLKEGDPPQEIHFRDFLEKAGVKVSRTPEEPKENQVHDEP